MILNYGEEGYKNLHGRLQCHTEPGVSLWFELNVCFMTLTLSSAETVWRRHCLANGTRMVEVSGDNAAS